MNMRTIFFIIFLTLCLALSFGQEVKYNTPQAGNPIIPGYFADPTIQKFGDTYYLYATTDGNGGGLGPSHCLLYTSPSPRDSTSSRMPSSA